MQRILRSLTPHWLRQLDHSLLISRPAIWTTRIHFVLFYGGFALGIAWIMGFLTRGSLTDFPNVESRFQLLMLPTLLAILFWM